MRYSLSHCRYVQAVNPLRFHPMLSRIQCEKHHRDRQAKSPRPAASRIQADCISQAPHLIFMGMSADDKIHSRQILPDLFFCHGSYKYGIRRVLFPALPANAPAVPPVRLQIYLPELQILPPAAFFSLHFSVCSQTAFPTARTAFFIIIQFFAR